MIIRDRSYPHPVLAPFKDDVTPNTFLLEVTASSDADSFYLDVALAHENPTLTELVLAGTAHYAIHVECKRNFFRQLYQLEQPAGRVSVSSSELVGRVQVSGFILASNPIAGYRVDGAHPDYGDAVFDVGPGDVLAVAPTVEFDAYVDYDPLTSLSSILTLRRSEDAQAVGLEVDFSGDRIVATLSQPDYDRYIELKGDPSLGPLLANQVVVPAILEAVHEIIETAEDDIELEMSKRWFRSIVKKLDDLGVDYRASDTPALRAAQLLLRFPLRRSLEGLFTITAPDGDQ